MIRVIKSLALTGEYEAVYSDSDGTFIREPIVGFAVVTERPPGLFEMDAICPVVIGDLGIEFCDDTSNYRGLVRVGEPTPEWMVPEVPA